MLTDDTKNLSLSVRSRKAGIYCTGIERVRHWLNCIFHFIWPRVYFAKFHESIFITLTIVSILHWKFLIFSSNFPSVHFCEKFNGALLRTLFSHCPSRRRCQTFLELFEESVSVFILWQLIKTFGHILCFPKSNLWILGEVKARRKNRKTIVLIVCCENSWKQDIEIKFFKTVGNTIQLNMRFKKSGPPVPCLVVICVGSRQNLSYGRADNNGWPMTVDPDCKKHLLWWFSNNFEVGKSFLILDTSEVGGDDPSTSNRWCQIMHRRGRQQQQWCNLVIFRDTAILDVVLRYLMWYCDTWCDTSSSRFLL